MECLRDLTHVSSDSKLIRLAIRFCLFRIKAFLSFLSNGKEEE
jgi:hypothetical protein